MYSFLVNVPEEMTDVIFLLPGSDLHVERDHMCKHVCPALLDGFSGHSSWFLSAQAVRNLLMEAHL